MLGPRSFPRSDRSWSIRSRTRGTAWRIWRSHGRFPRPLRQPPPGLRRAGVGRCCPTSGHQPGDDVPPPSPETNDGFPGVAGWGQKAAALVLSQYPHLEDVPKDWREWDPSIKRARALSESLFNSWDDALLFRTLATLRLDVPVFDTVEDLRWKGPLTTFEDQCRRLKAPDLLRRTKAAASKRSE